MWDDAYMKIISSAAYAIKRKNLRDKVVKRCNDGKEQPAIGIISCSDPSMHEDQLLSDILSDCEIIGIRTFRLTTANITRSSVKSLVQKCDFIYIQDSAYPVLYEQFGPIDLLVDPKKNLNPSSDNVFANAVIDILFRAHSGSGLSGMHALLIDDENRFSALVSDRLRQYGVTVTIGSSDMHNFKPFLRASDIVITCAYQKTLLTINNVHPKSMIIDISGDCNMAVSTIKSVGLVDFKDGFSPVYRSILMSAFVKKWSQRHTTKKG